MPLHRPRTLTIALLLSVPAAASLAAQTVTGTIAISRKLTRHSVTPSVPLYQRGPTVKLAPPSTEDPIDFERSHVVIYLEPELPSPADAAPPTHSFRLEQSNRQFLPDLLAIPAGATVVFPNDDPIFHNVFSLSHTREFDLGSYDQGDSRSVTFPRPGIVNLYCHLHPNMAATVFVTPNRYFARADRSGHYDIHNVPPGRYTVVAWHKAVGTYRLHVTVEPGHPVTADFVLPYAGTTDQQKSAAAQGDRK